MDSTEQSTRSDVIKISEEETVRSTVGSEVEVRNEEEGVQSEERVQSEEVVVQSEERVQSPVDSKSGSTECGVSPCVSPRIDIAGIEFRSNLVLSGGGIQGLVHIGALRAMQELGALRHIKSFAGTSVGGLIATLCVVGYSAAEMYEFIKLFDMGGVKDISVLNLQNYGLDSGRKLEYVVRRMIRTKLRTSRVTMGQLYGMTGLELILTTVCVNTMEVCYISHLTHPDLLVYQAVMMTVAIPFYYCPVMLDGLYYIDGGCFDNYPMRVYSDQRDRTVGVYIVNTISLIGEFHTYESYVMRLVETLVKGLNHHLAVGYEAQTVLVDTRAINMVDYSISSELKDELFLKGYDAMMENRVKLRRC
jgi:NTE family protein